MGCVLNCEWKFSLQISTDVTQSVDQNINNSIKFELKLKWIILKCKKFNFYLLIKVCPVGIFCKPN